MLTKSTLSFLQGGGEMGERTRSYNWNQTSIGDPNQWPQSLRTTLSIILNSKFPMFLFWGEELLCFYNDAYRPSLGNTGKHPHALGKPGAEVWPETWPVIKPLIDQVLAGGEATWSEDQLIPIDRNGKLEDVYWTFSYSPVRDESGHPAGVFVTCAETTEKVRNLARLKESKNQLEFAIEAAELATWDFNPITNTFTANTRYAEWFGIPAAEETDNARALRVIAAEDRDRVIAAYTKALDYASGSQYDIEYTIRPDGLPERVLRAKGKVWFGEDKKAYRFNGTLQDITKEARATQELDDKKQSLELAIEIGELGVFTIDLLTDTATYSQQVMDWFGLTEQRLPMSEIASKVHPDDQAFVLETLKRSAAGERDGRHDILYRLINSADGKLRYLRSIGQVQFEGTVPVIISGIIQDVTEQVLARKKIEESEAYFRQLTDTVPAIIWITAPDGSCTYLNTNWYAYTGQSQKEAEGFGWLAVTHPDDRERAGKIFLEANEKKHPFNVLYRLRHQSGAYRWAIDSGSPKFSADGIYEGMVGTVVDVHEHQLAKEALRASEDRYQNFVRRSSEGIWRFEVDVPIPVHLPAAEQINRFFQEAYLAECNDAMAQMYGYRNAEELTGMRLADFFPRDADTEAYFNYFIQSGYRVQDAESKELTKEGKTRYFSNNLIGIAENGLLLRAWGTQRDITAQRAAEEKIRESEAKLRSVIATAPAGIGLFVGRDLVIELPNQTFIDMVGKGPDIEGKPLREVMPELLTENQPFLQILDDVYTSGKMFQSFGSQVQIVQNGVMTDNYYNITYTPLLDAAGKVFAILDIAIDVTESVKAKQALEESRHRFQNLIRQATVGIIVLVGPAMRVEIVNEAYGNLIARRPEELIGQPLFDVVPDAGAYYQPLFSSVLQTGEPMYLYDSPYSVVTHGQRIEGFLNVVFQPYRDSDGTVIGVMALCHNVTEQVLAHKRLEESEQQLRSVVESAPFPIGVFIGKEMRIRLVNQSIIDIWGKGSGLVGKLISDVLPELENQTILDQLNQVYTTGKPLHVRNQRVDLMVNGKLQSGYFNYSFTPLLDSNGAVYGVMNTGADVTDLNLAKQKIQESEQNLRTMILQAPVAMCILKGADFVVDIANERMLEIFGKSAADILHRPLFEGLSEAKNQGFEALLQNVFETGETFRAHNQAVVLPRDGGLATVYVDFVYEAFREADNSISGVMAVAVDVTEQVLARHKIEDVVAQRTRELAEANGTLQKINQELSRSNTNLEEFAYAASHDLKEPVRKIHFFGDRLKGSLSNRLTEEEARIFDRMEMAAKRMSSLIDDLLTYSQISLRPRSFEEVDMNQLIDVVLSDLDLEIEEKDAAIKVDNLFTIQGHQRQLQQAFQNLIANALKYSKPDTRPEVRITCSKTLGKDSGLRLSPDEQLQEYYVVQVADNGIGFEQKDAERIFNVFTRLHGNAEFRGTGIGLSIVRKVLENHRGYITAESNPGEGAIFRVYLPTS